jgi:hypothetical protein
MKDLHFTDFLPPVTFADLAHIGASDTKGNNVSSNEVNGVKSNAVNVCITVISLTGTDAGCQSQFIQKFWVHLHLCNLGIDVKLVILNIFNTSNPD